MAPGDAEAYHFCGHIYTTDSCPHPTGLPRIDSRGLPLRAHDGHPIDDLGRLVGADGRAVDEDGRPLTDADGRPLPVATRTAGVRRGRRALRHQDPGRRRVVPLLRRPHPQARRLLLADPRRINGDASLTGYCYKGRKVFCVMYYDTNIKC